MLLDTNVVIDLLRADQGALTFVLERALSGGVTRSLALDAHGKSLGSALLSLEIPDAEHPDG